MASLTEQLNVKAPAKYRSTKAEIIQYYQQEYPSRGKGSWKQQLTKTMAEMFGLKEKSLEKRFDTQRRNNPEPRNAKQYEELGKTLPPIYDWPPGGIDVNFKGRILISRKWYGREFTVHFGPEGGSYQGVTGVTPEEAEDFLRSGSETWVMLAYFMGDPIAEDWEGDFTIL